MEIIVEGQLAEVTGEVSAVGVELGQPSDIRLLLLAPTPLHEATTPCELNGFATTVSRIRRLLTNGTYSWQRRCIISYFQISWLFENSGPVHTKLWAANGFFPSDR